MAATAKLDLFKQHKDEYATPRKPALVEISPAQYLVIDGRGQPGGDEFQTAIGALYGMAFTIKMTRKVESLGDYAVCKLEALWWDTDRPQDDWAWKMMIRTPDFVGKVDMKSALAKLVEKKKGDAADRVKLEKIKDVTGPTGLVVGRTLRQSLPSRTPPGGLTKRTRAAGARAPASPGGGRNPCRLGHPSR